MSLTVKSDGAGGSSEYDQHKADFGTASHTITSEDGVQDIWFNGVHYALDFDSAATIPIPVKQILDAVPIT